MAQGPRERLLTSAIALMCERGVHATGLTELLQHSGTARGSIYQHFPGGKSDLMEQATYAAGRFISRLITSLLETKSPDEALVGLIDYWIYELESSDYIRGCPILAAAQSGASEPAIQAAAASVFHDWADQVTEALVGLDVSRAQAEPLASLAISSIEGAITQSRARRSTQPLEDLKTVLVPLTKHTLMTAA
ncbi:TetR/AcrR family transcriptional regulator [Smaragdicoccus niigatensis]|uniref:TetR/AcrR family transcriptional regulator n=1 Tax=Smaragdicoccus niigatensis TaxID=359359 RepID=UPI00036B5584|nr:TetR/AcrR family transcriptional regulator [Smaragdicoccus niigatensis]